MFAVAVSAAAAAVPTNDNFGSAQAVSGSSGTITGSTVGATAEPGEPAHGGPGGASIWYVWTAPAAGTLTVTTKIVCAVYASALGQQWIGMARRQRM